MDTEDSPSYTRRRLLAGLTAVGLTTLGGCVSTGLSLRTDGLSDSDVFESVSLSESWTANRAVGTVSLTDTATTEHSVRELAVIDSEGSSVWNSPIAPGQTSVSDARFPVGKPARLVAADNSGAFVEEVGVTVSGSSFP
ncbi:hypothetical protein [Halogeometricum limi]|uniref:Tat (Twin-arginine translocation) pathway signal sequence n=1 Tax=Halogeometricum limi TaxID=555875 RepID=A0A1I6FS74_9EURY|nr:hypothetical protein [Halogeometricum limi]SFR32789.1 hypothetical protein SAMN04488124_0185 [Halogeometricum limi]